MFVLQLMLCCRSQLLTRPNSPARKNSVRLQPCAAAIADVKTPNEVALSSVSEPGADTNHTPQALGCHTSALDL